MTGNRGIRLARGVGLTLCAASFGIVAYILLFSAREQELPAQHVRPSEVLFWACVPSFFAGALVLMLCRQQREPQSRSRAVVLFGIGLLVWVIAVTLVLDAAQLKDWLRAASVFLFGAVILVAGGQVLRGEHPRLTESSETTDA